MKISKQVQTSLLACGLLFLILDSKTVLDGAKDGVALCIEVITPSLLPYFILTNLLTSSIGGKHTFLAVGLLGGYPAGAQSIHTAYRQNRLTKNQAETLLTYCNHAGPAFIFGIMSHLFSKNYISWIIWAVHLLSALFVFLLFHQKIADNQQQNIPAKSYTLTDHLLKSLRSMALVCCWIILFRIALNILDARVLYNTNPYIKTTLAGLLELSNGCYNLRSVPSEQIRFILCSTFIGFGGICVTFQTASVTGDLSIKKYLSAKLIQGIFSTILSFLLSTVLFR